MPERRSSLTLLSGLQLSKEAVFFWIIVAVLVLYCLPLVYITKIYVSNASLGTPLDPDDPGVEWFLGFARGHQGSFDFVQKVLLPLITFIAAASFATAASTWRTLSLSLLLVVFLLMAFAMQVTFDTYLPGHTEEVSPYFSRLEEALATYLILILGLKVAAATGQAMARPETRVAPPQADNGG